MQEIINQQADNQAEYKNIPHTMSARDEIRMREWLAAYFISSPRGPKMTEKEKAEREFAIKAMSALEIDAILQSAGISRPLRYGDVTGLLRSVMAAGDKILRANGGALDFSDPGASVYTSAEPRLLQLTLARMLRIAAISCKTNAALYAAVTVHKRSITVTVTAPGEDLSNLSGERTAALMRETARLHKGMSFISGETAAFSIRRELPGAVGLFGVSTVKEILDDPLSPVKIGMVSM